ncbi:ankyrin repeat-containing domain protein [Immersiella caudata]|uniref:Ankyrin repeat-containing domain protein n=1 Tax=Immersiella caudata TaxID=314043 RepID=A0AA39X218_9PEZI|nr:ankyrin repeat-containing domain protein [Immersiella caudata]
MDDQEFINRYLEPYLTNGNRECLTELLPIWTPELDEFKLIGLALHRAIHGRDEVTIRMILEAGIEPTIRDDQHPNYTLLLSASEVGLVDTCRLIWQLVGPAGRANSTKHEVVDTCLSVAAENGHTNLVAFFLDIWSGWSSVETTFALTKAVRDWHEDVVDLLLTRVSFTADALQRALEASIYDRVTWIFGGRDTDDQHLQQHRIVTKLLDAGANPNELLYGKPILHSAIWEVHHEPGRLHHQCVDRIGAVRALLEKGAEPNAQDNEGKTALHILFRQSGASVPALRLLLEHGASPEVGDQEGEASLHAVAYSGDLERLQLCLAHCPDPGAALRLRTRAPHGKSLLHYAAAGGQEGIVDFLLRSGLDVNSTNGNGWTPLLCALTPTDNKWPSTACRAARLLLDHGADAKFVSEEGWSPLHALVSQVVHLRSSFGNERGEDIVPLARELIARGASLDAEAAAIRSNGVTQEQLSGKWGSRMGKLCNDVPVKATDLKALPNAEPDTTPLMWAYRVGAMGIFDAIMEHWASTESAEEKD